VWKAESGGETRNAVLWALEAGYRGIDTATIYKNETDVGAALRECGLPRKEYFITTKIWYQDQGYEGTLKAFDESMKKLGLDYLDLYLIHHVMPPKTLDTWRAMEKLYKEKRIRAIGVSNFLEHHIDNLIQGSEVKPAVDQVEMHPYLQQRSVLLHNREIGIQTESWAPIAKGTVLQEENVLTMAAKYGKTPAQVVLRWGLQLGVVLIPKSIHKDRIIENTKIFDFELTQQEMVQIDSLECNKRFGSHPDNTEWMK